MTPALTFENLLAWTAQVLVIAIAGAIMPRLFRIHHPRFQLFYSYALLAVCIGLPLIQPLRYPEASLASALQPLRTATSALATAAQDFTSMRTLLLWIIVAGILTKFGFFIAGTIRISLYRKCAIPLNFPKESILSICKLINRDVEIGVSASEVGPVTFGWLRPMVLLPGSFLSLDEEAQRAILCHELLHVVRRDWLATIAEEAIGACLWFHPAIWWMLSRIRLKREELVDFEVVRLTSARDSYIDALLAIAGSGEQMGLLPAPLFLRKQHLTTRVRSLLTDQHTSGGRMVFSAVCVTTVLIGAAFVSFNTFPLMAAPPVAKKVAAAASAGAETPQVFNIDDGVTPPRITRYIAPEYSDAAREAKIEGMVVVEAVIQADGTVGAIAVKRSLHPDLDHNAVYALQQWRFEPSRRGTVPVDVWLFIEMNFQLKASTSGAR